MNSEKKTFKEGGIVTGSDFDPWGIREGREKGEVIVPSVSAKINARWEKLIEAQKNLKDALQSNKPHQNP